MKYKAEARAYRHKKSNVLVPWEEYDKVRTECYKAQKECENQLNIVRKFLEPIVNTKHPEARNIDMYSLMQKISEGQFQTHLLFTSNPYDVMHENKLGWYIEFSDFDLRRKR